MNRESVAEDGQEIRGIVAQLRSCKTAKREEAERQLRKLGPEAVHELLAILVEERLSRKKRRQFCGTLITAYFGLMFTLAILTHHASMLGSLGSMTGAFVAIFAATQTQRSLAKVLAELEDLRTVGALAEALEYQDKNIVQMAENTLISLLPRLKASDAGLLDADQRASLNRALSRKNSGLVRAILGALEQVGDETAVPFVQKLADGHGHATTDDSLHAAAQQCLPYLLQRAEEQRSRQTLLRASSVADGLSAPDMLLRPASGITSTDPAQLLRANLGDEQTANGEPQVTPSVLNTPAVRHSEEESVLHVGHL